MVKESSDVYRNGIRNEDHNESPFLNDLSIFYLNLSFRLESNLFHITSNPYTLRNLIPQKPIIILVTISK